METEGDFEEHKWVTKCVNIRPNHAWCKDSQVIVKITHCSFAIPNNKDDDYCAILTADSWTGSTVICKLLPNDVSKKMNTVLGATQKMYLANKGNRPMTVTMLIKDLSD